MLSAPCSPWPVATAVRIASYFGDAIDSTMPSMRYLSADNVNAVQPDVQFSDSDPLGLIQMIRRTDLTL